MISLESLSLRVIVTTVPADGRVLSTKLRFSTGPLSIRLKGASVMVNPGSVALSTVRNSVLVLKPLLAASAEAEFRVNSVVWLPSLMLSSLALRSTV